MNSVSTLNHNPKEWTVSDVKTWLIENELSDYVELFCDIHHIDGRVLTSLRFRDLLCYPLMINAYGDARKIIMKISELKFNSKLNIFGFENSIPILEDRISFDTTTDMTSDEELNKIVESGQDVLTSRFETKRCLISFAYLFISCYLTALAMAIVHNRVPDMAVYPPLPDILLENLPLIKWAFKASEIFMILNFLIWCLILVFHQYRFILIKRYCSIFGTVFLLRCLTMLSTSLSVPGKHHKCVSQVYDGWRETLKRSFEIMGYVGMSINGVQSCGDYMFSGHTVCHTLLTLFIHQYTPKNYYALRFISKVMAIFGMFLILAAHEHYTLDVICAIYVCIKTFSNYHVLITAKSLSKHQTKCWNPMFYYLEKPIEMAMVPNVYENPLETLSILISRLSDYAKIFGNSRQSNYMSNNREAFPSYSRTRNYRRGFSGGGRSYSRGGRRMETVGNFMEVPKKVFNVPLPITATHAQNDAVQNPKTDESVPNVQKNNKPNLPAWSKSRSQIENYLDPVDYPSLDQKTKAGKSGAHVQEKKVEPNNAQIEDYSLPVSIQQENIYIETQVKSIKISDTKQRNNDGFANANIPVPGSVMIKQRDDAKPNIINLPTVPIQNSSTNNINSEIIKEPKQVLKITVSNVHKNTSDESSGKNSAKNSISRKICIVNSDGSVTFVDKPSNESTNQNTKIKKSIPPARNSHTLVKVNPNSKPINSINEKKYERTKYSNNGKSRISTEKKIIDKLTNHHFSNGTTEKKKIKVIVTDVTAQT